MRVLAFSLIMLLIGALAVPTVHAQPGPTPIVTIWDLGTPPGSGTGDWNVATNWSRDIVPDVTQEDAAIINGGGTAQVTTAIGPNVGSVVLGQGTAANESGTRTADGVCRRTAAACPGSGSFGRASGGSGGGPAYSPGALMGSGQEFVF